MARRNGKEAQLFGGRLLNRAVQFLMGQGGTRNAELKAGLYALACIGDLAVRVEKRQIVGRRSLPAYLVEHRCNHSGGMRFESTAQDEWRPKGLCSDGFGVHRYGVCSGA